MFQRFRVILQSLFPLTLRSTFPSQLRLNTEISLREKHGSTPTADAHIVPNAAAGGDVPVAGALTGPQTCIICGEGAPIQCEICHAAYYCSLECQETDEFTHNYLCRDHRNFNPPLPNGERRTVRAILFDCAEDQPIARFIRIPRTAGPEQQFRIPPNVKLIDYNMVRNRALQMPIRGYFQAPDLNSVSYARVNSIIHACKRWDNIVYDHYRPNRWANDFCWGGDAQYRPTLRDVTYEDFRHIMDSLSVNTGIHSSAPNVWAGRARKVRGVKIHCREDQQVQFEALYYPQDHPIFKTDTGQSQDCQISIFDLIGLPLLGQEKKYDLQLEENMNARSLSVPVAEAFRCISHTIDAFPHSLGIYTRKQLDVNFVRADGKDLDVIHMSALWNFIEREIVPLHSRRADVILTIQGPRGHLLEFATRANFERFWNDSFPHGDAINPYEVV